MLAFASNRKRELKMSKAIFFPLMIQRVFIAVKYKKIKMVIKVLDTFSAIKFFNKIF